MEWSGGVPRVRWLVQACLVFSGLCALVYQIVWTRLLGLSFGTTTEAVATVLGVFFGGLALGSWLAARALRRVRRPLRVYAALEAFVGAFALASLPLLRHLDQGYAWLGVPETPAGLALLRVALAALLLLPPTLAMGATLPVVARAVVARDETLGRACAGLYAANTLGAVLGAYSTGFWWIPQLGLARTVLLAGAVNLAVGALVFAVGGGLRAPEPAPAAAPRAATPAPTRRAFLLFFAVSGFVAIGYEIVWSKVFGIVMQGTLYGFASVLSAVLAGIALGSAAVSPRVDRLADPPRAFALLHLGIGAAVVAGMAAVPYLPWLYERLARAAPGGDAVHLLFLLVLPIVLLPMALFGAAFPILIRIQADGSADAAARGLGVAGAVNTAGSIAASFLVGFWWIPAWGTDATLYALLLADLGIALWALAGFQRAQGRARAATLAGALATVGCVALAFNGVRIEDAVAGRQLKLPALADYLEALRRAADERVLTLEGRAAVVTLYENRRGRLLRTNGLPEASLELAPPHRTVESTLLALWPYALATEPRRALVIGLGGGNTLAALLESEIEAVEVVELEREVVQAARRMHAGFGDPLADPRVALRIDDGRDHLLRHARRGAPGYDLISSQPSHPWRVGAANLFTEDFFRVAREALAEGGVFAAWLNGFRIDAGAFLAVVASFERAFPGALLVDASAGSGESFLLLGGREPLALDAARLRARLAEPGVAAALAAHGLPGAAELLAQLEGPAAIFAALAPGASNTDDNAYVETRSPRALGWSSLDFAALEARLPADAPWLPPVAGRFSAEALARALLAEPHGRPWQGAGRLARLLAQHGAAMDPFARELARAEAALRDPQQAEEALRALRALADAHPARPEPWRLQGAFLSRQRGAAREASLAFAEAFARGGAAADAFEAGRALHAQDPAGARRWFARIPPAARAALPLLAVYEAAAALERGLRGEALAPHDAALARYLASDAGRADADALALAGRIAAARGDALRARRHADADARLRAAQAEPLLARAEAALAAADLAGARAALDAAARLRPGDEKTAWLRAELALRSGAPGELERALEALRDAAPTRAQAEGAENAFRSEHGLPLATPRAPGAARPAPATRPAASARPDARRGDVG
jgi:spermidine synthase